MTRKELEKRLEQTRELINFFFENATNKELGNLEEKSSHYANLCGLETLLRIEIMKIELKK